MPTSTAIRGPLFLLLGRHLAALHRLRGLRQAFPINLSRGSLIQVP